MTDIRAFPYFSFVKFDLVCKEFERQFNEHFDEHIRELAQRPGFDEAWRTRELRSADNEGQLEQEYQQIYAIADPALFKSFPDAPRPPVTERDAWRRDNGNWGRVFYRALSFIERDSRPGRCWARLEVKLPGVAAEAANFQIAHARHMRSVSELPGVHRAWQLQYFPHAGQIGPAPAGDYMALYEVDAPENIFDPSLGADRVAWKAGAKPEFAGRHFARLLLKAAHAA